MSALMEPPVRSRNRPRPQVAAQPRLWTCEEFWDLGSRGLLGDGKFMLVDGVILEKPVMNDPHAKSVEKMNIVFVMMFGRQLRLRPQLPFRLDDYNDPEPDYLIAENPDEFEHPSQSLLLVEVEDSTLNTDLGAKKRRYASGAIPEYWVVDLRNRKLLVFRDPAGDAYATALTLSETDTVAPLAKPDAVIKVADLLP
jgi:Uma2 family endonuclease